MSDITSMEHSHVLLRCRYGNVYEPSYVIQVVFYFAKLFVYCFIIMPELPRVPLVDERQP